MLKYLSIFTALTVLGASTGKAQPQEAVLRKVELPEAIYSIVVAMPKSPAGVAIDLRGQPDPTVAYIADGALVLGIDRQVENTFRDIAALQHPSCSFRADGPGSHSPKTVAVYVVRNDGMPAAGRLEAALESLSPRMVPSSTNTGKTKIMSLTRLEPRSADFDIVFGITTFPGTGKLVFKYDGEEDEMFTAIMPMLVPSCITHVDYSDGTADVIAVYVVPKEENIGPPMQ